MSDTTFLGIAEEFQTRIESISTDDGYFINLGESVYVNGLQPFPVADEHDSLLPGSVVVEAGAVEPPDPDDGGLRSNGVTLEALFERDVTIIAALPVQDKNTWLNVSEHVAADLRRALFQQDQTVTDWRTLRVKRIWQTNQTAAWPQEGSRVLHVETTFRVRYVEK